MEMDGHSLPNYDQAGNMASNAEGLGTGKASQPCLSGAERVSKMRAEGKHSTQHQQRGAWGSLPPMSHWALRPAPSMTSSKHRQVPASGVGGNYEDLSGRTADQTEGL